MGSKGLSVLVVGAGQRGKMFARFIQDNPDLAKVTAVCDLLPKRRAAFAKAHLIPEKAVFASWEEVTTRIADVVFICNQDAGHAAAVLHFAPLGYHILCEKPMATTMEDCLKMRDAVKASGGIFAIGHVLRYSPYTVALQQEIASATLAAHSVSVEPGVAPVPSQSGIGEVLNVVHLEGVGWYHFAHSYVRGNWAREADSAPSLLAKSCHDLDLLLHVYMPPPRPEPGASASDGGHSRALPGRRRGIRVSSFGSLTHFRRDRKPAAAAAATRCVDCSIRTTCAYSATRIYADSARAGNAGWPVSVVCGEDLEDLVAGRVNVHSPAGNGADPAHTVLVELVESKLRDGPYGRCVYECDNDVVDNQVVNIEYEGGRTASFTMMAFTKDVSRRTTRIHGSNGEIVGDMQSFEVFDFGTRRRRVVNPYLTNATGSNSGHGGGDHGIARTFLQAVAKGDASLLGCTVDDVFDSHAIVFAAEAARREGVVVSLDEFIERAERELAERGKVAAAAAARG
ncbi:streptomycin biosynthesis protein StrI [Zopfochytrium polystomum]|nr:streptomycin biosynthesis protein StrI [Zopfochytrium polystomum]